MLFPNLLNHYIETTSLFMNYSATNFIQLTLKILAFSMLTLTMLRLNVNITKHYLKIQTNFKTEDNTEDFPVDAQD